MPYDFHVKFLHARSMAHRENCISLSEGSGHISLNGSGWDSSVALSVSLK